MENANPLHKAKFLSDIRVVIRPLLLEICKESFLEMGGERYSRMTLGDLNEEILAAIKFLMVYQCDNIKVEKVAAPEALNKKRIKAGKPALDDYHLLKIDRSKTYKISEASASDRKSPRQHFRRGHVRKHPSGKRVWVSHCMVGKSENGIVNKDYIWV